MAGAFNPNRVGGNAAVQNVAGALTGNIPASLITSSSGNGTALVTGSAVSGIKYYLEFVVRNYFGASGTFSIGAATPSASLSNFIGDNAMTYGFTSDGNIWNAGTSSSGGIAYAPGEFQSQSVGVLLDGADNQLSITTNGTTFSSTITLPSLEALLIGARVFHGTDTQVIYVPQTQYAFAIPAGYTSWDNTSPNYADRTKETTTTTGTGTVTTNGAVASYQTFATGLGSLSTGIVTNYTLLSGNNTDWETGQGTVVVQSGTTTISRDTVFQSSNGGNQINLTGTSTIFCDLTANFINQLAALS